MKKNAYFLCTLLFLSLSHTAKAAPEFCSSIKTGDINQCADYLFKKADKALNTRYKEILSILPPIQKDKFIQTQRLWLIYRDSTCEIYKPSNDGTYSDGSYAGNEAYAEEMNCRTDLTESRTLEIETVQEPESNLAYRKAKRYISERYYNRDTQSFESDLIESARADQHWFKYASSNCKLTAEILREDYDSCLARQAFFRYK